MEKQITTSLQRSHLCWNITTKCNQSCRFCHRITNKQELPFEDNLRILIYLKDQGIKKITWTGGEALLYPGLATLLKCSAEFNIRNNLISNGQVFSEMKKEDIIKVLRNVDEITLSLDAVDDEINGIMGRSNTQYENVIKIVEIVRSVYPEKSIKINTVASKINFKEVVKVGQYLQHIALTRWKIFMFNPLRGAAKKNDKMFEISEAEFEKLKTEITSINLPFNVYFYTKDMIEDDYSLILADGTIVNTKEGVDYVEGSLCSVNLYNW